MRTILDRLLDAAREGVEVRTIIDRLLDAARDVARARNSEWARENVSLETAAETLTEVLDEIESRNLRIGQRIPRFIVDGHEFPNEESNLMGDGEYPPFYVFDVDRQTHVIGHYSTRDEAQRVADLLNAHN